jgi:S1-C subfamily serine protease
VRYTEYDVSRDGAAAEEMVRMTGQMGVPVTVIDGQAVIGFDRAKLQELVAAAGRGVPVRLGVAIADAKRQNRNLSVHGAFIGRVAPGSIGERAGLKAGDVVTEVNRRGVGGAADMEDALADLRPGDVLSIVFLRGTETKKSEIII